MLSLPVSSVMLQEKFLTASPTTTVASAARLMAQENASAVVVVNDDELLGIFTKSDAVYRTIAEGLDPRSTPLSSVMTENPRTVEASKRFGSALHMMCANGFRHLPVVENGRAIGMVTTRKALDPELEEFAVEAERRRHYTAS